MEIKMGKKLKPIRMEEKVYTHLQRLSFEFDKPLGEVLEGLAFFARLIQKGEWTKDEKLATLVNGLLKTSIINAGKRAVWVDSLSDDELKAWVLDGLSEKSLNGKQKAELQIVLRWLRGKEE
jgi:hypothetical protein